MAEQPTDSPHQPPAADEVMDQVTESTYVSASDEHRQMSLTVEQQEATTGDTINENGLDTEQQAGEKESVLDEVKSVIVADESSSPDKEVKNSPPQADDLSHGDYKSETPISEKPPGKGELHAGEKEEQETPPTVDENEADQLDGPKASLNEEPLDNDHTNTEAVKGDGSCPKESEKEAEGDTTFLERETPQETTVEEKTDKQRDIETIGPEPTVPVATGIIGGSSRYLMAVGLAVVCVAILVQHLCQPVPQPQKKDLRQVDIFVEQMGKVKSRFPKQRVELWHRSKIHLERHLRTAQPTEPVSIILTAGLRAEKTLHCLARGLASSFSSALNASVLHIDGASKASQDSDQVKLDIDGQLQAAFEGDKPVAVIHRFEELPPSSTLIFYRYCDHENAAYKRTFLIFTVLLGEEVDIPAKYRLSTVEEMVDDQLKLKFLSDGERNPVSFDRMDLDKYSGLWSRISHLILPVAAEERIERKGC